MAAGKKDSNSGHHASSLHLVTPAAALEALREPTAGVDLMNRHNLNRYEGESGRNLRRGISHFLSPQLQVLIKEKPRIALAEKAEFAELLSEELSGRPIQELSIDLLRRSFMIRRRVANGSSPSDDDDEASAPGRPPIPPDVPFAEQTTNKASPAFAKKVGTKGASVSAVSNGYFSCVSVLCNTLYLVYSIIDGQMGGGGRGSPGCFPKSICSCSFIHIITPLVGDTYTLPAWVTEASRAQVSVLIAEEVLRKA